MKVEIEAKMQVHDGTALLRRLAELHAVAGPAVLEVNTYFDTPQTTLRTSDQGLRLRVTHPDAKEVQPVITITHKGPRAHGQLKSRSETELEVADADAAGELLSVLGFQSVLSFEKRRQTWHWGDCQIAFDQLPYLGQFVEIEGPSEEAVMQVRDQLGLSGAPLLHASYIAMLANYLSDHHLHADFVSLKDR